ncbi:hypothetical protein GOODEAATRI_013641 [Goodea atripinnis]|uniref:Uncharacterized protein n=1 Tax=Goodea atripinnis TaxID=208336 RepID=A0ABV0PDU7_9TELE
MVGLLDILGRSHCACWRRTEVLQEEVRYPQRLNLAGDGDRRLSARNLSLFDLFRWWRLKERLVLEGGHAGEQLVGVCLEMVSGFRRLVPGEDGRNLQGEVSNESTEQGMEHWSKETHGHQRGPSWGKGVVRLPRWLS